MLEFDGLTKRYGSTVALQDLTFAVRPGEVYGFVGANGAGKTTAMRIALGVLAADAGEVRWQGRPVTFETRRRFGYMPEERGLYPKMRVAEQLVYFARLHGLDPATAAAAADRLTEQLGVAERRGDAVERLSLGNQQRIQLAAALVHDPEVLVLDEPFSGLDPVGVDALAGVLLERPGPASRWSSPPTSWSWWSGCATRSASSTPAGWSPPAPCASCAPRAPAGSCWWWCRTRRPGGRPGCPACEWCPSGAASWSSS